MKPFPTDTIADLSTAHLSLRDMEALQFVLGGSVVINYPTGFFVYTGGSDEDSYKTVSADYTAAGLNPGIIKIIRRAQKQGCKWVCFDADGPVIEGLKVHKH